MKSRKEIEDRIRMIESVQETQSHQIAIPAAWLEQIRATLQAALDDDIPTLTDYVGDRI